MRVVLGLGANIPGRWGEPVDALARAIATLHVHARWSNSRVSPLYRTAPVGEIAQPDFANAVLVGEWEARPSELWEFLAMLMVASGRGVGLRWGPRTLDLDVLTASPESAEQWSTLGLTVPHRELSARRFVVEPLAALYAEEPVPGLEQSGADLAHECTDRSPIIRLSRARNPLPERPSTPSAQDLWPDYMPAQMVPSP